MGRIQAELVGVQRSNQRIVSYVRVRHLVPLAKDWTI